MQKAGFNAAQDAAKAAAGEKAKGSGGAGLKQYTQLKGPSEKVYLVEEGKLQKLQALGGTTVTLSVSTNFAELATNSLPIQSTDEAEWEGWMAMVKEEEKLELKTSLDWNQHTHDATVLTTTTNYPFFID